ncbi:MAG: hypothetical protein NTW50_01455 [Candidatus Berkelbacteria bacterium]|nr:hypothetical protein [Candidatus Berkelbacteria bacterium]
MMKKFVSILTLSFLLTLPFGFKTNASTGATLTETLDNPTMLLSDLNPTDSQTVTSTYTGRFDNPSDQYYFKVFFSKYPNDTQPTTALTDTSTWDNVAATPITLSSSERSGAENYTKTSTFRKDYDANDGPNPGRYWVVSQIYNGSTPSTLKSAKNFILTVNGNDGGATGGGGGSSSGGVEEGSTLNIVNDDSFELASTAKTTSIDTFFQGKLTGDSEGDQYLCQIYITPKTSAVPPSENLSDETLWALKKQTALTFIDSELDLGVTYQKKCSFGWSVQNGSTTIGQHWIYTRIYDQTTETTAIDNFSGIDILALGDGGTTNADGDIEMNITGLEQNPDHPERYFYDLGYSPRPTANFKINFAPKDTAAGYKLWLGISYDGYEDTYDGADLDPSEKWNVINNMTDISSSGVTDLQLGAKQFSESSDTGYHQISLRIYANEDETPHFQASSWIYVGRCAGTTGLCDDFKMTLSGGGSTAASKGNVSYNLDSPSPISIKVHFSAPDNLPYTSQVQVSNQAFTEWGESQVGVSGVDWSQYSTHNLSKSTNPNEFTETKDFASNAEEGFHEVNVRIFQNGSTSPYITKSAWIYVGHIGDTPPNPDNSGDTNANINIDSLIKMGIGDMSIEDLATKVIFRWLPLMIGLASLAAIGYSGFLFMSSRGEEKSLEKAKKTLLTVVIGMIIGTFALSLVAIVVRILNSIAK